MYTKHAAHRDVVGHRFVLDRLLDRQAEVKELLQVDKDRYDLMAIISLGYPLRNSNTKTQRKPLSECVISYK